VVTRARRGLPGLGEDQHPYRAGAEHAAPQTSLMVNLDGAGAAVAGHGDRDGGRGRGQLGGGADPGAVDPGPAAAPQTRRVVEVGVDVPEAGVAAWRPGQGHVQWEPA
jgi:hypothetical protein